jgi:aminoglycoside 3-N-acetyltransferase
MTAAWLRMGGHAVRRSTSASTGLPGYDRVRMRDDLRNLGLPAGAIVLVHASLRKVSPVGGDPGVVADALLDVLGPGGTLVVPAQTTWNSTTSRAFRTATRRMTPEQVAEYKDSLPAFDPRTTPSSGMGALAEYVRKLPQAVRSAHPQTSFAAVGARAAELMSVHLLESHLGEKSPLGALYANDAQILMLGTGYSTSTVFHLAEYKYQTEIPRMYECRIAHGAESAQQAPHEWTRFTDIDFDDADFERLGTNFERKSGTVRRAWVGGAVARLYPARRAVEFAVDWMSAHRQR